MPPRLGCEGHVLPRVTHRLVRAGIQESIASLDAIQGSIQKSIQCARHVVPLVGLASSAGVSDTPDIGIDPHVRRIDPLHRLVREVLVRIALR